MLAEAIPHLSLGSAILIIFLICAAFIILRGIFRVVIASIILTFSTWITFIVWQYSPSLSVAWFDKSMDLVTTGLPIITFIVVLLGLRYGIKFLLKPLGSDNKETPKRKPLTTSRVAFTLIFSLLPTSILFIVVMAMLHHHGTVAELKHFANKESEETHFEKFTRNFKNSVEQVVPEPVMLALDPLADKSRVALAKVITHQSEPQMALIVDPETNEPIPRAIIVEDAEVNHLVEKRHFSTLLRHPVITDTLKKPEVQEFIRKLQL